MNSFVGVAAPSDLVRSILVEILHSVECGNVKQGVLEPRNKSPVFAIALYLSIVFLSCMLILFISFYMLDIFVLY